MAAPGGRTALLLVLALLAFAGNSLLCRLALRPRAIDPASFALLRVVSGAAALAVLTRLRRKRVAPAAARGHGSWTAAAALAGYAVAFSFAYLALSAATDTLLLFSAVQLSMTLSGLACGERPPARTWIGFAVALSGTAALLWPGLSAPDPLAAAAMLLAGLCWGIYSLRGRRSGDPTRATAANFGLATPLCALAAAAAYAVYGGPHASWIGAGYALASGALTSGLGYVLWYAALPHLPAIGAAIAQLTVPVLVAVGGVLLLDETVTARLLVAGALVLGGVGFALRR